jgi:predicted  nucleic acid-binding Zn-ribbon protein
MSPIGRVFLVLNLGLAGAFVAFSGTYLQRADHWKTKFDDKVTSSDQEIAALRKGKSAAQDKFEEEKRLNGIHTSDITNLRAANKQAKTDNDDLKNRLTTMEGTLKSATSHLAKIGSEVATARQESKAAMDRSVAAQAAKDAAESKMNAAQKALADANFKIGNQTTQIGDQGAKLARANQTIRENEVLLDLVVRRHPGIFETLHPLVTGTVSRVGASGNLVTILLQSGAESLKSGARFAIYSAKDGYKGEATVSEVDSSKKFCFARLTLKNGKIDTGDNASTNLSAGRSN